ncbi:M23 family metallopeptidase [Methylomonas sp. LL1]|nr:M23 family metallopeptidase [Methylomonas sp. LL1]
MLKRRFLLISLLLISSTVAAKKLYKYQDQQGRWYFSDKPPATEQKVEVRQLKPAANQRVWLEQSGAKENPGFDAINQYPGPVEISVDWGEHDGVTATPPLPQRFLLEPGRSKNLFTVKAVDQTVSRRFTLQFRYMIGRPLPDYVSTTAYLPPVAPGGRFLVTQAFEGDFSHTDVQNRYAVDIMMPTGTPIHAARGGIVLKVENDFFSGGTEQAFADKANSIHILHEDGSMAVYAHLALEKALVHPGLQVQAGELIAYSGNTGFSSGPHLHFAVQVNRGMELASVPFEFIDADDNTFVPRQGRWLLGINAPP